MLQEKKLNKKVVYRLFFIFFLLLPLVQASEEWIYRTSYFNIETDISSSISIKELSHNTILEYIKAELFFFPYEDERQKVLEWNSIPEGIKKDSYIEYIWENPQDDISFSLKNELKTYHYMPKIKKKIPFPIQVDESLSDYIQPTKHIDSDNDEIIIVASSLASGHDDLYDVVFTLAKWVLENINYSLQTLTETVSQKASWVIENRYGVCDEITILFIAMCRSLGIPARYVGGLAYTNWNDLNDFGPHAWAEVYFPSVGWVPYDITYSEFGFIDGTHIKLKEYIDPEESSTRYEWRGRNIDIITKKLDMNARILAFGPEMNDFIKITTQVLKDKVGFGSYNLFTAEIQNLEDYYVSSYLSIIKSAEVTVIGEIKKHLFLKPYEKKKVFWILKIDDSLDKHYIYTFPLSVYSIRNSTASTDFQAQIGYPFFTYKDMKDVMDEQKEEQKKVYSQNVNLRCETNESSYYINEKILITCTLKNTGNVLLKDIKVCLEKSCHTYDLGINQQKIVYFSKQFNSENQHTMKITASNSQISKAYYLIANVYERPNINIENLNYPKTVSFNEEYKISFLMNKTTKSIPRNIIVSASRNDILKEWTLPSLPYSQEFVIELNGKDLSLKENIFIVKISYEDEDGYLYDTAKEFSIDLMDVTLFEKVIIFIRQLDVKLQNLIAKLFR